MCAVLFCPVCRTYSFRASMTITCLQAETKGMPSLTTKICQTNIFCVLIRPSPRYPIGFLALPTLAPSMHYPIRYVREYNDWLINNIYSYFNKWTSTLYSNKSQLMKNRMCKMQCTNNNKGASSLKKTFKLLRWLKSTPS